MIDVASPEAEVRLGRMYHLGSAGPQRLDEAERLYRKAAASGSAKAMFYVGVIHRERRDYPNALHWFEKSSEKGYPAASHHLGRMYLFGVEGVAEDREIAMRHFDTAANQGHLFARRNIALEFLMGRRGFARIPSGILMLPQIAWAVVRIGWAEAESDLIIRL